MKLYKKIIDDVSKVLEAIAAIMLVSMVTIIFYHVVMRYFFNQAPRWSEEVSLQLMIWFCFIAMLLGVKDEVHISIDLFVKSLPPKILFYIEIFDKIMILLFGGLMAYFIQPYIFKLMRNKLPATGMSVAVQYVVPAIVGLVIVFIQIEKIILQVKGENKW